MENEYCPFQKECKYAKSLSQTEDMLVKELSEADRFKLVSYRCKAVETKPIEGSVYSYVNHFNTTLRILDNLLKIEY